MRGEDPCTDTGHTADVGQFARELGKGLSGTPKKISSKYLYDATGSWLFEQICGLEEYYLTRLETTILKRNIAHIAGLCGPQCLLVELGCGNIRKSRLLLDALEDPVGYVPIDISAEPLMRTAADLEGQYPGLEVVPLCADFTLSWSLPPLRHPPRRKVFFFPGSTIGNFEEGDAVQLLAGLARNCRPGDGMLIGADLVKEKQILERAYDDPKGVTAAFNLNLLNRANRELGARFRTEHFRHRALFNQNWKRVEMHLVSQMEQEVEIGAQRFRFAEMESVITEYSYKYTVEDFRRLLRASGWNPAGVWTDPGEWFSVHYSTWGGGE